MRARAIRTIAWLGPDFTTVLVFAVILAALAVRFGGTYRFGEGSIVISLAIGVGLVATRFSLRAWTILSDAPGARREFVQAARTILRDWGPLIAAM